MNGHNNEAPPLVLFSHQNFHATGTPPSSSGGGTTQINIIPNGGSAETHLKTIDLIQSNTTKVGISSGTVSSSSSSSLNIPPTQIILSPRKHHQPLSMDFGGKSISNRTSPLPGSVGGGALLAKPSTSTNTTTILPVAPLLEGTTLTAIPKYVPTINGVVQAAGSNPYQITTVEQQLESVNSLILGSSKTEGIMGLTQTLNLSTSNNSNYLNGNPGLMIATSSPGGMSEAGMITDQQSLFHMLNNSNKSNSNASSATGSGRRRTTSTNSNG